MFLLVGSFFFLKQLSGVMICCILPCVMNFDVLFFISSLLYLCLFYGVCSVFCFF